MADGELIATLADFDIEGHTLDRLQQVEPADGDLAGRRRPFQHPQIDQAEPVAHFRLSKLDKEGQPTTLFIVRPTMVFGLKWGDLKWRYVDDLRQPIAFL
jgi:hypothetical protein